MLSQKAEYIAWSIYKGHRVDPRACVLRELVCSIHSSLRGNQSFSLGLTKKKWREEWILNKFPHCQSDRRFAFFKTFGLSRETLQHQVLSLKSLKAQEEIFQIQDVYCSDDKNQIMLSFSLSKACMGESDKC